MGDTVGLRDACFSLFEFGTFFIVFLGCNIFVQLRGRPTPS